jgi:dimethylargininase
MALHLVALTREVSPTLSECELIHLPRQPIDVGRARAQHHAYEACLAELGCEVRRVPPEPELPDAVFVEDTAVVFAELAIVARPGAASRRAETASVAGVLGPLRPLAFVEAPATLDGGDVLVVGRRVFVGLSGRTNPEGAAQVRSVLSPFGYSVEGVPVRGCLHLKSAVTMVAPEELLISPARVDARAFQGLELIEVDPAEPFAANALRVGETVVFPVAFPRTRGRLEERGLAVRALDVSELARAEGALTCCSLIVPPQPQ